MGEDLDATEAVDHISELPDCIIHKILSFLPKINKDVGRTSVLSKRWNNLLSTFPYLEYVYYPGNYYFSSRKHCSREEFLNILESSIQPRFQKNSHIYRFQMHIDFPDLEMLTHRMDRWLGMAVEKNVEELDIFAFKYIKYAGRVSLRYSVPQVILISKTLKSLQLWGCKLGGKLDIKLPHVQKVEFYEVKGLDVKMFENFTHGCPSIENLSLVSCHELRRLFVTRLLHLRCATFTNCHGLKSVEINVPNLQEFAFDVSLQKEYIKDEDGYPSSCLDVESVKCEVKLFTCTTLKSLRLCGARMSFESIISILVGVEVLILKGCYSLESFELPFQNLKKLVLNNCHNLLVVGIGGLTDSGDILSMPLSSMNNWHPKEVHFEFSLKGHDLIWWSQLKDFLTRSCTFYDDLKLALYNTDSTCNTILIHDKLAEVSLFSLFQDKDFWRNSSICISSRSYSNIVDNLLWENRSAVLSVIGPSSTKFIELLYKRELNVQAWFRFEKWWYRFCGLKMTSYELVKYRVPTLEVFMNEHSVNGHHTTTFLVNWDNRLILHPYEADWSLDVSLTNLRFKD